MELKDRLRLARKAAKLSQAQVAESVKISQATYSELERGITKSTGKIVQIAQTMGVNVDWLATGKGQMHSTHQGTESDNLKPVRPARYAPVLNYVQAGQFTEVCADCYDDYLPVMGNYGGDDVYWLEIEGRSMENDFMSGEKVLINASRQPSPGNFVVARKMGENSATLKKYRPKGFDINGMEYCHLVPSNPEFPIIDSRFEPFEILGVAVERNQKLV